MSNPLYKVLTPNGHKLTEVVSALQKMIRRCQVDDALYFAVQMYAAGYAEYAWTRMRCMVSEDIGLAEPNLPANFEALYESFLKLKAKKNEHAPEKLPFVHAVILVAQAKKSRMVDHALSVHFQDMKNQRRDIPDCAYDCHTAQGKSLGRESKHFYEEAALLNNKAFEDPYEEKAKKIDIAVDVAKGRNEVRPGSGELVNDGPSLF